MKKLLGIIVLGLLLSGNAFGQSMISLRAYVEKNKNNKDYEYYIYYRCTAVYTYATRSTTDEEEARPERSSFGILALSLCVCELAARPKLSCVCMSVYVSMYVYL